MKSSHSLGGVAAVCTVLWLATSAGAGPATGQAWTANGASACERFLTPEVEAAIVVRPTSHPERLDVNSCRAGIIYVTLKDANIDVFRQELKMIVGVHTMSGVGDGAYWNEAGAMSAVKGHRGCDISVIGAPGQMKIHNADLGQKLGEICNKLFALP